MRADRLLRLADWLDRVDPERFYMCTWAQKDECGTTACAMGHACDIPEFKALGLRLDWSQRVAHVSFPGPTDTRVVDMSAAQRLFDIEEVQAMYLFASETEAGDTRADETPKDVAKRIRELVANPMHIPDDYFADPAEEPWGL